MKTPEEIADLILIWGTGTVDIHLRIRDAICCERERCDEFEDKCEGLEANLDSALTVLIKHINGEKDLTSAGEWVRLNYPNRAGELK